MTALGIAIGVAAALALSTFMSSVLYEVTPGDPVTYLAVAAILLAVALLATLIPARRATGVDPLVALRAD
jgi:ABC-type antimicrobial peptide transport system permease subunit